MLGMQSIYRRVKDEEITSVARWLYLILLITMVQVFRDGLVSLIAFPCVFYVPLIAWAGISKLMGTRNMQTDSFNLLHPVTAQSKRAS
jgi:hypothetical protein